MLLRPKIRRFCFNRIFNINPEKDQFPVFNNEHIHTLKNNEKLNNVVFLNDFQIYYSLYAKSSTVDLKMKIKGFVFLLHQIRDSIVNIFMCSSKLSTCSEIIKRSDEIQNIKSLKERFCFYFETDSLFRRSDEKDLVVFS